jgi:hypothetical protein
MVSMQDLQTPAGYLDGVDADHHLALPGAHEVCFSLVLVDKYKPTHAAMAIQQVDVVDGYPAQKVRKPNMY